MKHIFKSLVEMQEYSCKKHHEMEMYGRKESDGKYHWITFGQYKTMVDQMRSALTGLGVEPEDKVGIISRNSVEWSVCCYATFGRKAHFVSMYENQTIEDWHFIIEDSTCKVVFVHNEKIYDEVITLVGKIATLKHVVLVNEEHYVNNKKVLTFKQLLNKGAEKFVEPLYPSSTDTMGLIYTSGTTGKPKGVELSHGNILANLFVITDLIDFGPKDRSLSILPWAHVFGQTAEVHALLCLGFSAGIAEGANTIVDNIAEIRPTILFAVPRLYNRIYDGIRAKMDAAPSPVRKFFYKAIDIGERIRDGEDIPLKDLLLLRIAEKTLFKAILRKFGGRLQFAVSGASALNPKIGKFVDTLGITVLEAYGLSETSPLITSNNIRERRFGSVGKVASNEYARVRVEIDYSVLGESVQSCEDGEVIVYGPNVMKGYYNRPLETKAVMTEDGGFRTGDLGRFDQDGFLYITGRIKEQYKLENGKYVVPNVMEDQLKLHPLISNSFVYGTNKEYNIVLLVPEMVGLEKWASEHGISKKGEALLQDLRVKDLFQKELDHLKEMVKHYEYPRKFALVNDDWSIESGLMTPTLKVRRQQVYAKYKELIESLY
ncbi:MAG: AMP-binding protein [Oligoflexia bacterium]|nr:AMP-binding protein [Oligoflexia bacterium]MBF0365241.1 AMP-binding protein [Oligoflexia bacterium]